jgi:hypothetical protein
MGRPKTLHAASLLIDADQNIVAAKRFFKLRYE